MTNASTAFSGTIAGAGGFAVSGGTQTLQEATVATGIIARDGGAILVNGGEVHSGTSLPAMSIINGGAISTASTSLSTGGPTAYASFDVAGRTAAFSLGTGTVIEGDNGVLLLVERVGDGSDGIVTFDIATGVVTQGDILDQGAKTGNGGTTVTIAEGASWTGLADAASFVVQAGGTAVFEDGSKIDGSLTAEAGANIFGGMLSAPLQVQGDGVIENGAITGNVFIAGNLELNGLISPGASPGTISIGGNLNSAEEADSRFEVSFGLANPQAGVDYDQLNVGYDVNGTSPVVLSRWASSQSTPLGNLDAIELIRVGGEEFDGFVQSGRFVQYGHEVVLERRTREVDPTVLVEGGNGKNEQDFFGSGDLTVYGLRAFVQDETLGLATLTGTAHQAGRDVLGTFVERRRTSDPSKMAPSWARAGVNRTEVDDAVSTTQKLHYWQAGFDLVSLGDFRAGLLGSYGSSRNDVETYTGVASLDGDLWSGGIHAQWASAGTYIEAIGQYGVSDWTFSPTNASKLTTEGETATAALEIGHSFHVGSATFTPWGQFVYQTTAFDDVESAWVDEVEFVDKSSAHLRGGIRAEASFGSFAPYVDVALSHDFSDRKAVVVDGFEFATGMGGTRVEVASGFQANVGSHLTLFSDFKGGYGIGDGEVISYQGQAGLRARW